MFGLLQDVPKALEDATESALWKESLWHSNVKNLQKSFESSAIIEGIRHKQKADKENAATKDAEDAVSDARVHPRAANLGDQIEIENKVHAHVRGLALLPRDQAARRRADARLSQLA